MFIRANAQETVWLPWVVQKNSVENFHGDKPNIIDSLSEFGRITYITKQYAFKKQITDNTFKDIMGVYRENHTRDTYKLYNTETKRAIITWDIKWVDWKMTDPAETLKIFCEAHKEYLVPGIEEYKITTSEPEDNIPVQIIPYEVESVRPKENLDNSSDFTYHKKDANTDTSLYNMVLNALKNIDTSYN